MRTGISTYVFVDSRLHPGMLDKLAGTGADAIEIFAARGHFDYTDRQQVREIANWFKHSPVVFHSMHSPIFAVPDWGRDGTPPINLVDRDKARRVAAMDEIKRALEVAEVAPFHYLVQHLTTAGEQFEPHKFEHALSSIEHLHAFAKPLGVKLLVENLPNEMTTPEKLVELLNVLHIPDLGVCFDLGHAHIMTSVREAFETLRPHIHSTHLHDNRKDKDEHLFPGEGSIDWNEAMTLLSEAPLVPPLVLEISGENRKEVATKFSESFRLLDQAASAQARS